MVIRGGKLITLGWGVLGVAACTTTAPPGGDYVLDQSPRAHDNLEDAQVAQQSSGDQVPGARSMDRSRDSTKYGTGVFVRPPTPPATQEQATDANAGAPGGESFQFRDAPIDLVLNQVLGETFGLSYVIDPNVQGRLTLRLDGLTDGQAAVAALDAALRLQNIRIAQNGSGYIVSRTDSGASGVPGDIQIIASPDDVPTGDSAVLILRYANAEEVTRLAKPLLAEGVVKLTDPSRGLVLLQGSARDVAAGVEAIRSFDVDWFEATSSAFVELRNAAPDEVKRELDALFDRTGGVEIISLPRLGALMIFARNAALLDRAQSVLADLDRARRNEIYNETLIYEAQYVSAERLQNIASSLFQITPSQQRPIDGAAPAPISAFGASPRINLAIDELSNLVVVQGSEPDLVRVDELFTRIDRPQKQILIEATIVEVSLRDEYRFGISWAGVAEYLNVSFTDSSSGEIASKFPGVSIVYNNTDIVSVLNALDTTTDVQIVSSPRIMALNNESARIQVGDQVPVVTQSAVSITDPGAPIVNSTTYRDTGVILDVTPRVRAGDIVEIAVAQEVSDVSETVTSGIDSPTISQRRLESVLAVPNGATIALGGLINSNRAVSETGVPVLKDIPVVDNLFSSKADILRKTELVVLLRPVVLDSDEPVAAISDKLREALERVKPSWPPQG